MVAGLDHPHIVPVYDVGQSDEFPCYVVSKFVEGSTLSQWIRQSHVSPTEAAEIVATVAEALHYAHARNIVHRDIKNANIMLDVNPMCSISAWRWKKPMPARHTDSLARPPTCLPSKHAAKDTA